jgi:hypothetical protein
VDRPDLLVRAASPLLRAEELGVAYTPGEARKFRRRLIDDVSPELNERDGYLADRGLVVAQAAVEPGGTECVSALDFSMSRDGRYVLFRSTDASLAANDTNGGMDVFRWDRTTNAVQLVSANAAGTGPGNAVSDNSERPVMTLDGRFVAFSSSASDLSIALCEFLWRRRGGCQGRRFLPRSTVANPVDPEGPP